MPDFDPRDLSTHLCPDCRGLGVVHSGRLGGNCPACAGTGWNLQDNLIACLGEVMSTRELSHEQERTPEPA